jgi:hypothetical protein
LVSTVRRRCCLLSPTVIFAKEINCVRPCRSKINRYHFAQEFSSFSPWPASVNRLQRMVFNRQRLRDSCEAGKGNLPSLSTVQIDIFAVIRALQTQALYPTSLAAAMTMAVSTPPAASTASAAKHPTLRLHQLPQPMPRCPNDSWCHRKLVLDHISLVVEIVLV